MEDEDSIVALLDFEVWFVPRSGGGQGAHAHAPSTSQQEASGPENRDQQPQQSTGGAQPSGNEEAQPAQPSGKQARGKQRGGRTRGGRRGSAGRQPASKKGDDAADAEEEGEGPAKRARTESDTHANQGPTVPGTVVVPTSKFALCTRTKVLRPILAACKQAKLEVPYDSQEHLKAGKMLVQLLHDLAMPEDLKKHDWNTMSLAPSLAVQVCRWAIYWDAPAAVELCLGRLSCYELEVLSAADISGILDLPSAVTTMPLFAKAKERCAAWLLWSFSDVPSIIADDGLRASFCSKLSFAAVALWAEQGGLNVRSENEVAVTLSFWYEAQESVSNGEAAKLSRVVRVGQMSQSFRHFILPKLDWFDPSASLLPAFNMACDNVGAKSAAQLCTSEVPAVWVAPARKPWLGSAELTFVFQKSDLVGLLTGVAAEGEVHVLSQAQSYFGFFFRMFLELYRDGTLWVSFTPSGKQPIPAPEAVYVSYSFDLVKAGGSDVTAVDLEAIWFDTGSARGIPVDDKFKSIEDFTRYFGESLQIKVKFYLVK